MTARLHIVQLNIEQNRHLEPIQGFFSRTKPDVVCVQELLQSDIEVLEKTLGAKCFFTPMSRRVVRGSRAIEGIGIFSRFPIRETFADYYAGPGLLETYFDLTDI